MSSPGAPSTMRNSGRLQPALDEIVQHCAPCLGAFAAHALDREQNLLAVRSHAKHNEQRDRGRLAVEPHPNDGAVEDQPHDRLLGQRAAIPGVPVAFDLAPGPAHRVLADRPAEQGRQRATHPPGIGAGQIAARDQRIGGKRASLIGPQGLALPFRRLALRAWSAGHAAPRSRSARTCPSATASGCHGGGP